MLDAFVVRLLRRHVGVCHVAAPQANVNHLVLKRTRSPSRRRRWGRPRTLTAPARARRRTSGIPCPCNSAFVDGRHDGAIMQHDRLQRHENVDLRRETRPGRALEVAVDAP